MKKLIAPLVMSAVLLTGCGEKVDSPEKIIEKNQEIMSKGVQDIGISMALNSADALVRSDMSLIMDDTNFDLIQGMLLAVNDPTIAVPAEINLADVSAYDEQIKAASKDVKTTVKIPAHGIMYDGSNLNIAVAPLISSVGEELPIDISGLSDKALAIPMDFVDMAGYTGLANLLSSDIVTALAENGVEWEPLENNTFKLVVTDDVLTICKDVISNNKDKYIEYVKTNISDKNVADMLKLSLKAVVTGVLDALEITYTEEEVDSLFASPDETNTSEDEAISGIVSAIDEIVALEATLEYTISYQEGVVKHTLGMLEDGEDGVETTQVVISVSDSDVKAIEAPEALSVSEYLKGAITAISEANPEIDAVLDTLKGKDLAYLMRKMMGLLLSMAEPVEPVTEFETEPETDAEADVDAVFDNAYSDESSDDWYSDEFYEDQTAEYDDIIPVTGEETTETGGTEESEEDPFAGLFEDEPMADEPIETEAEEDPFAELFAE